MSEEIITEEAGGTTEAPERMADILFGEEKTEESVASDGLDALTEDNPVKEAVSPEEEDEFSKLNELDKDKPEEYKGKIDGVDLKLPPGVTPDNPEIQDFVKLVKEADGKPEGAQKLLDMYMTKLNTVVPQLIEQDRVFREKIDRDWIKENTSDPEFGGSKYAATSNLVTAAMRKFVTKEEMLWTMEKDGKMGLLEFFKNSTTYNYPVFRRMFARIGKYALEAQPITSDASNTKKDPNDLSHKDALFGGIK